MSLAEPQRSQREKSFWWASPMKMNNTDLNALRLISLSEIKPPPRLRVLERSGREIKKCLSQSRRDHRERNQFWLASPRKTEQ